MANYASVLVDFSGVSEISSFITIRIDPDFFGQEYLPLSCRLVRTEPTRYSQGVNADDQADKYAQAAQADIANNPALAPYINVNPIYNGDTTIIQIEANKYGVEFFDWTQGGVNNATVTVIPEVLPVKDFQLTGATTSAGINPCQDATYTVTQNGDGVPPFTWITPVSSSTDLTAQIARAVTTQPFTITIEDSEGDQATLSDVFSVLLFDQSFIQNIGVVTNAGGLDATVTIQMTVWFTYSYSLDGTNWQPSNVFSGVTNGDYTLYVSDQYGCIVTQAFTVDTGQSEARSTPNVYVSNANTLRHIQQTSNRFQTLENTLYRNEYYIGEEHPDFAQVFENNDGTITTQFQTNYDQLSARIVDYCDSGIEQTITINKKSDNIGKEDKRDCTIYNAGNNQTGVYFTTGNIYDPISSDITGSYELDGNLPEWAVVGNTVIIDTVGTFVIKQTYYDSSVMANVLIIDYAWTYSNQNIPAIISCSYDSLPYEVYEFDIDLSLVPKGTYYTQIVVEDSQGEWPSLVFNSELFAVDASFDYTNFIEYWDSDEAGIDYSTGYRTILRIESTDPYQNLTPGGTSTQYNNSIGNTEMLKNNSSMIGTMFFANCPRYMIEKLNVLFGFKNILINGLSWTKEDDLETINFDKSALKNATITVKRKDYNSNNNDNIDIDGPNGRLLQENGSILR